MTEEWSKELIQFEESQIVTTYKIGILNATQNQITDDDFFNNRSYYNQLSFIIINLIILLIIYNIVIYYFYCELTK